MKLPFSKYHLLHPKPHLPTHMETTPRQLQALPREPASTLLQQRPLREAATRHNTHSRGVFFIGFLGVLPGVEALCYVISSLGPASSSTSTPSGGPLVPCPETGRRQASTGSEGRSTPSQRCGVPGCLLHTPGLHISKVPGNAG